MMNNNNSTPPSDAAAAASSRNNYRHRRRSRPSSLSSFSSSLASPSSSTASRSRPSTAAAPTSFSSRSTTPQHQRLQQHEQDPDQDRSSHSSYTNHNHSNNHNHHHHHRQYVWVRTELVEAIHNNHGTLPKNWRPPSTPTTQNRNNRNQKETEKRSYSNYGNVSSISSSSSSSEWGWCRALVVRSSSSSSMASSSPPMTTRSSSTSSYRMTANNTSSNSNNTNSNNKILATITIDDDEFAPPHLQGVTVSLSYDNQNNNNNNVGSGSSSSSYNSNHTSSCLVYNANTWWSMRTSSSTSIHRPEDHSHSNSSYDHPHHSPSSHPHPQPPQDLTSLVHLHEPAVVYCLQKHYDQDSIYVYTGKILLAMNPFRVLEGQLYGDHIMKLYYDNDTNNGIISGGNNTRNKNIDSRNEELEEDDGEQCPQQVPNHRPPPHVYAVAQEAYRSMLDTATASGASSSSYRNGHSNNGNTTANQTILVSGESGAGKTVTTKIIMGYLAGQSQRTHHHHNPQQQKQQSPTATANNTTTIKSSCSHDSMNSNNSSNTAGGIESQILQSNPILESFGNARTVRNDNSSRFGKFMELLFMPNSGALVSASIETYLLEKVRLISQSPGERNYHIFYELLAGLSQSERHELHVENDTPRDFVMTSCSGTFDRRDGVDDRETYQELVSALNIVGFTKSHQKDLFSVACALLHTSNLTFQPTEKGEGSELCESRSLNAVLALLGVPVEALNNALCLCAIVARGETFHKKLSIDKAMKALEALIKATYGALFKHIVRTINESIGVEEGLHQGGGRNISATEHLPRIGVLDIFGFESFQTNSFEQLCINYCNEALQQQFNKYVFKLEQQEYEQEGIDWSFIEFPDNQDILDLIEKRREGILSILDENCRLATCTDSTFCRSIYDRYKDHTRFSATRTQQVDLSFSIQHYAGTVMYNAVGFVEKNKDELPKETTELLTSSSVPFCVYLGELLSQSEQPSPASTGANGKSSMRNRTTPAGKKGFNRSSSSILRDTVGHQFSIQLQDLRDRINATKPHYVRCLKPNDDLVPNRFEPHVIADQLRCAGVLEAIRVSRVGFPHRYFHDEFVERYSLIVGSSSYHSTSGKDRCLSVIKKIRPHIHGLLHGDGDRESLNFEDTQRLVGLGMQMGRRKVFLRTQLFDALELLRNKKLGSSAVVVQTAFRRYRAQAWYRSVYAAALSIQCFVRRVAAYREAREKKQAVAATKIQTEWRRFFAETELMAARLIAYFCQAHWRGAIARQLYAILTVEKQALLVQRWWRGQRVRIEQRVALRAAITLQCAWRSRAARRQVRELRREARSLGVVVAERDRFKEESQRLKKEVEMLRSTKKVGAGAGDKNSDYEVERLRREVERLQTVLAVTQASVVKAPKELENGFHPNNCQPDALSTAWPSPGRRLFLPKNGSPDSRKAPAEQITPTSIMSPGGRSTGTSSVNVSLLDTDPHDESADFQLQNVSQNVASPNTSVYQGSMTGSILDDHAGEDLEHDEHPHRMEKDPFPLFPGANEDLVRLHGSIWENDLNRMQEVLENALDPLLLVNEPNKDGHTALHVAVESNNIRAARLLFEKAAVSNAQNNVGDTPLHLATDAAMVKLLLEHGNANPDIPNLDGVCALHKAVERLDVGSVRVLVDNRAKSDVADNANWFTPMHLAVLSNGMDAEVDAESIQRARTMIVDLLCWDFDNLDLNYQDNTGNTPLHYAVQIETPDAAEVVGTLLGKGADPNIKNSRNQQALLLLCHNDGLRQFSAFQECLHSLLFHGANPNHQSNTGCTPLHLSLYHNDVDAAVQLVHNSAELHLLWKKPKTWTMPNISSVNDSSELLALDMVVDEHSIHRILASISHPMQWAPTHLRPWCMNCNMLVDPNATTATTMIHCRHCGRHVCGSCARTKLTPGFFPESFEIHDPAWVCLVCERILVARQEEKDTLRLTQH